jgi:NDP-sugar pyrophosphorylase family protein
VVDLDGNQVVALTEKPTVEKLVNAGIYVLSPEILSWVPRGMPSTVPDLLSQCLARNKPVGVHFVDDEWMDVGRFDELQRARGLV